MSTAPPSPPLITANMVTGARLLSIPVVCWLTYADQIWLALGLGIVIGCTDFVDGYLARKYGPTVLGGLMDPIADKVFIAFTYLPLVDLNVFPSSAVALLFMRELGVNGLRSGLARRGVELESNYLGKVKTWTQMQGLGTVILFVLLWEQKWLLYIGVGAMAVAPAVFVAIIWQLKRELWWGALVMTAWAPATLFLIEYSDTRFAVTGGVYLIVTLTMFSGNAYFNNARERLADHGGFDAADYARLLGAITLPAAALAALSWSPTSGWLLIFVIAFELAAGGLDDLQARHQQSAGALAWGGRVLVTSALLGSTLFISAPSGQLASIAALLLTVVGVSYEFWRSRALYLNE